MLYRSISRRAGLLPSVVVDAEGVEDVEQGGDEGEKLEGVRVTIIDGQSQLPPIPPRGPQALKPSWPHALTLLCPLST